MKSSTFAFICSTPLQVLNSINFVLGNCFNSRNNSDLYIYGGFNNAEDIYWSVKKSGVFQDVFYIRPFPVYRKTINRMLNILRFLFPKRILRKYSQSEIKRNKTYNYLCFTYPAELVVCMNRIHTNSALIGIDDGLLSYTGDAFKDFHSNAFKIFIKYVFRGKILNKLEAVYLYNPEMVQYYDCVVKKLPLLRDVSTLSILEEVFHYKENDLYITNKIIYLTQPLKERKGFTKEKELRLISSIKEVIGDKWVVRVHPRQQQEDYDDCIIDQQNNMWELECIHKIGNNNVLIGAYSTAQFYPKMLVDKEPYIIFTYRLLFKNDNYYSYTRIEEMIGILKKMYLHPEKIIVPNTLDEFKHILSDLC